MKPFDPINRACGLNADWSVRAWHLGSGRPNVTSGDHYVLDNEDGTFSVVSRLYDAESEDNGGVRVLANVNESIAMRLVEVAAEVEARGLAPLDSEQWAALADPSNPDHAAVVEDLVGRCGVVSAGRVAPQIITIGQMREALLAARKRTGDNSLSHAVKQGKFQLQRITFGKRGVSTIVPLTEWQDAGRHLAALNSI